MSTESAPAVMGQKRRASQEVVVAPFSRRRIHLEEIMLVYEKIRRALPENVSTASCCVLFPRGVMTVPASNVEPSRKLREATISRCQDFFDIEEYTHYPILVYDFLSAEDGWSNAKPPEDLHQLYIARLREAVDLLNATKVAHLDLRSANIMWRVMRSSESSQGEKKVEMKVIDFDDAVPFGEFIPQWFVKAVFDRRDHRYPFLFEPGAVGHRVRAAAIHNEFFAFMIEKWLSHSNAETGFDHFMRSKDGRSFHDQFFR